MVNSKNVAFKVEKQTPICGPRPQPSAFILNCRKPQGKRTASSPGEVKTQLVPLTRIAGFPREQKRKRSAASAVEEREGIGVSDELFDQNEAGDDVSSTDRRTLPTRARQPTKPTKFKRGKYSLRGVNIDCWFEILKYSDPAQLLEMHSSIAFMYRFLKSWPMLWKLSRDNYHKNILPDPPSVLSEFQYAQLRHGHGCMRCGKKPSTRKTYWAFLRRWCKSCLHETTIKESDALKLFNDATGEELAFLHKCLPSGIFDSWGNFVGVGVGPAQTHSIRTAYLRSDVEKLIEEYTKKKRENPATWHAEVRAWIAEKSVLVEERRQFAKSMESWEDQTRASRSHAYSGKKEARKRFFKNEAAKLCPPISLMQLQRCASYQRAIAIPKEPNMTSWLQLKPKLEVEMKALCPTTDQFMGGRPGGSQTISPYSRSATGISTPPSEFSDAYWDDYQH